MTLCSKCKVNPAIIFVTKVEAGKTTSEGLCLSCAKSLGIAPIDNLMKQFGVDEEELDTLNSQMSEFLGEVGGVEGLAENMSSMIGEMPIEGGAPTAPADFLKNIFGSPDKEQIHDESRKSRDSASQKKNRPGKKSMLDTYGTNLTAKAALGQVDRVINREAEIQRVIQILNRRSKNNPVLLGEPGVGKTAIAE
ncbi:MAG: ATP-dependent Clp protease ATP-binding subunit, partial [Clostridia bacterium]|nr:ATP-dependent Clp protease ATP-binding subunit [Clostridia bacterium]